MAWAYSDNVRFPEGESFRSKYDEQPVDADTLILAGCPVGANAGSAPAKCARPCAAGDVFLGFAVRSADNRVASASKPDLLNFPNYGDGTTGVNGAKVRVKSAGPIQLPKAITPDTAGVVGNGITGLAGTQADVGTSVYYNGTGFTNVAGGNTKVGVVTEVKLSNSGGVIWELEIISAATLAA
jgi:hypothetical protein